MQKLPGKNEQIIGSVKRQRKLPKAPQWLKKYFKIIIIVALVALIVATGVSIWNKHKHAKNEDVTYAQMITAVDDNIRNYRTEAAKMQLESYLAKENPQKADHLFNIYARLAAIYNKLGDYKTASKYALKAIKYNKQPSPANYLMVAETSAKTGDKQTAIEYYQKALDALKNSKSLTAGAQAYAIQTTIDSLKAGK